MLLRSLEVPTRYDEPLKESGADVKFVKISNGCLCLAFSLSWVNTPFPASAQARVLIESSRLGGLRTTKTNSYRYRESSFATAVSNASGAALASTGTNLSGFTESKSELNVNPVLSDENNQSRVYVLGSRDSWSGLQGLQDQVQQKQKLNSNETNDIRTAEGSIDVTLIQLLSANPAFVETVEVPSADGPTTKVQLSTEYDQLLTMLEKRLDGGAKVTQGGHVINRVAKTILNPIIASPSHVSSIRSWSSYKETNAQPLFIDPDKSESLPLALRRFESESHGSVSQLSHVRIVLNGYGQSLDPFDENSAAMSTAVSSTTKYYSLRVPPGASLSDLASKYGTTVEQIMSTNNISDPDADLSGLNINLPSTNSSVGAVDGGGKSLAEIALDLDVPVDLLVQANPTFGAETQLPDGTMVNIPGALTDPSFPDAYEVAFPEPVDTPNELEYIDYGAYTAIEKVYEVERETSPLFTFTPAFSR